jgi:hypothetical protein
MNPDEAIPPKTAAILDLTDSPLFASDEDWQRCAETMQARLLHPVQTLRVGLDQDRAEVFANMIEWFCSQGYRRILILPCSPQEFDLSILALAVAWLRQDSHGSQLGCEIYVGDPLSLEEIADTFHAIASELPQSRYILLSSHRCLEQNCKYELCSLQQEWQLRCGRVQSVSTCFAGALTNERSSLNESPLSLDTVIHELQQEEVLWVPWRLTASDFVEVRKRLYQPKSLMLGTDIVDTKAQSSGTIACLPVLEHPAWLHLLVARYLDGLNTRSVERYFSVTKGKSHLSVDFDQLRQLDRRMEMILPSEYRGKTEQVSPKSMGSAGIKLDSDGRIAWDEIWTSFCDLAMAGGPPHRGTLLEAVSESQACEDMDAYQAVATEIRRGIEMVTGLKTQESSSIGWIGVLCDSQTMAAWLMRAIITENVMVRREGNVLYLPAGPKFTIKREVKNVITSVAKTVHYYRAHLRLTQRGDGVKLV